MEDNFPSPPSVIARILEAAADPAISVAELARLIEKDAVLSALALRTVNSASFGLRQPVTSVARATTLMGVRAVRNLVLCLSLRQLVPTKCIGEFPVHQFWEASLRRGAAAQCLAEQMGLPNPEELFTLGLCQDIGVLVHVRTDVTVAARAAASIRLTADRRLEIERESGRGHDEVGFEMLTDWRLPEELTVPIRHHHAAGSAPAPHRTRAEVAQTAEAIADLPLVEDKRAAMELVIQGMSNLGLEECVGQVIDRVNALVNEFAELIGLKVAEQPTLEQIMAVASAGLAEMTQSYEQMTQRLSDALIQQQRMAALLQNVNQELEKQVRTDELTTLPNRRHFEESLTRELAVAQRQRSSLSIVMLDLDGFKLVNDTHGHQAGDAVLAAVGRLIHARLRTSDTAARYGGEEFAILMPFTTEAGALIAAERLREAIEGLLVPWQGLDLRLTASLGGTTLHRVVAVTPELAERAVRSADNELYRAKAEGRNRVCWTPAEVMA